MKVNKTHVQKMKETTLMWIIIKQANYIIKRKNFNAERAKRPTTYKGTIKLKADFSFKKSKTNGKLSLKL